MLVICSENDPLIGKGIDEARLLEQTDVVVCKTKLGGHLGYYEDYLSGN